jgi:hypothetical protein
MRLIQLDVPVLALTHLVSDGTSSATNGFGVCIRRPSGLRAGPGSTVSPPQVPHEEFPQRSV